MNFLTVTQPKKRDKSWLRKAYISLCDHEKSNAYLQSSLDLASAEEAFSLSRGKFQRHLISLKDLISNRGRLVTGGSRFLRDYRPPFSATICESLFGHGAVNIANANADEFGLGGTGLCSAWGAVRNPVNGDHISGGSSSGSAYLVGQNLVDFSIGSDTGDSARLPASYCGVYGFKPSFGKISRYGFFPFCSQLDTPSILAGSVRQIASVFSAISYPDPRDLCTLRTVATDYLYKLEKPFDRIIRIGILGNTFWTRGKSNPKLIKQFQALQEKLVASGDFTVEFYDFPQQLLQLANIVYSVVAWSESISHYSNMTGLLFPFEVRDKVLFFPRKTNGKNFHEILFNNRRDLGHEFKFRNIMGMYFLNGENYRDLYLKSKRIITLINKEVNSLFKGFDFIISPTADSIAPRANSFKPCYSNSNIKNILLLANFCSLPAISIPWIELNGMPVGLHLMADFGKDEDLLRMASLIGEYFDNGQ